MSIWNGARTTGTAWSNSRLALVRCTLTMPVQFMPCVPTYADVLPAGVQTWSQSHTSLVVRWAVITSVTAWSNRCDLLSGTGALSDALSENGGKRTGGTKE